MIFFHHGIQVYSYFLSGTSLLRWRIKVEELAEKIKGTRHLLVEPFSRVLGNFMVDLEISRYQMNQHL